jgi:hypothetical protein
MDRTVITLHEYRMRYPDSAAIPTLTQSGLLGVLLDRQRQKAASKARRHAMWSSVCALPRKAWVSFWRALTVPELRSSANHAGVAAERQT